VFEWRGSREARIRARLTPGEVVSVQINYHPGWHATAGNVGPDGIGLMVIEPKCVGDCEISLRFDGGLESWLCRMASGAALLWMAYGFLRKTHV
jgi:hypothetical protein